MKIRILYLIDELQVGGTEKQLIFLANFLPIDKYESYIGVFRKNPDQDNLEIKVYNEPRN